MDFVNLMKERRSASNFLPDKEINQKELNEIFELVKLGPSAFNLQHTNYITVMDPGLKEKVRKAAKANIKFQVRLQLFLLLVIKKLISRLLKYMKV